MRPAPSSNLKRPVAPIRPPTHLAPSPAQAHTHPSLLLPPSTPFCPDPRRPCLHSALMSVPSVPSRHTPMTGKPSVHVHSDHCASRWFWRTCSQAPTVPEPRQRGETRRGPLPGFVAALHVVPCSQAQCRARQARQANRRCCCSAPCTMQHSPCLLRRKRRQGCRPGSWGACRCRWQRPRERYSTCTLPACRCPPQSTAARTRRTLTAGWPRPATSPGA